MAPQASADCLSEAACYYRARYYDPQAGRFVTEDPVRWGGGIDLYAYTENDPVNFRDPSGKKKVYGNWCGPNWTGGLKEPYNPAHASTYKKPIDAVDETCMHHDICYFNCRGSAPCNANARMNCMRQCDRVLLQNIPKTKMGNIIAWGIKDLNELPNPDSNKDCGCKYNVTPLL